MTAKRTALLLLALMLALQISAVGEQPAWTYPVKATVLEDKTDLLVLTNKSTLIAADYVPYHLVDLPVRATGRGMQLRKEAADALKLMFDAAEKDGFTLYVKSAYRSYQVQKTMYDNRIEKYKKDDGVVALPGSSDHQTGLAVDILNFAWTRQEGMRPEFSLTEEAKWLAANCARFGFILRYMEDKQEETGIIFEPWHFRFVGQEAAQYMMDEHLSLEEFTEQYRQAIKDFELAGGDFKAYCKQLNELPPPVEIKGENEDGESEVSLFYTKP